MCHFFSRASPLSAKLPNFPNCPVACIFQDKFSADCIGGNYSHRRPMWTDFLSKSNPSDKRDPVSFSEASIPVFLFLFLKGRSTPYRHKKNMQPTKEFPFPDQAIQFGLDRLIYYRRFLYKESWFECLLCPGYLEDLADCWPVR